MISIRDVDAAPAPQLPFVAMVEVLNAMQVMKVPHCGCVLAVDFQGVERLVPASVPGRLECRKRSVLEAAQEGAGVVDSHRFDTTGEVVFSLFDERFRHGDDFGDRTVEPHGSVDSMCQEIAGNTAARYRDVQPPQAFTAL